MLLTDDTVRAAQAGDEDAFEALYRAHSPRIHAIALRMTGNLGRAEDVTQEVFFRAWRSLLTFRFSAAFTTWLVSIAVNLIFEQNRKRIAQAVSIDDHVLVVAAAIPDTRLDLERAVATLPERARMAVLLAANGHAYDDIARLMDTSIGTVKAQIHRARQLLKEALQ